LAVCMMRSLTIKLLRQGGQGGDKIAAFFRHAEVAELVDALDLGSSAVRCAGSIPVFRTRYCSSLSQK
jgi:hypothetical protein